jgi:hypothetical protein
LLASCTNEIDKNNAKKDVVDPQPIVINSAQSQAPVFIRTTNIKDKLLIQRININQQNISLIDANIFFSVVFINFIGARRKQCN